MDGGTGISERTMPNDKDTRSKYGWAADFVKQGGSVLDAGCAYGEGTAILAARANSAVGIDSFDEGIDYAQKNRASDKLKFVRANLDMPLPFVNASFDTVVALDVIEHVKSPVAFLQEIRRVLKPGGEMLLLTPNKNHSDGQNPYHISEMMPLELKSVVERAGFVPMQLFGILPAAGQRNEQRARLRPLLRLVPFGVRRAIARAAIPHDYTPRKLDTFEEMRPYITMAVFAKAGQ